MELHFPIASRRQLQVLCLALACTALAARTARADDKATAQVLFDAARALMDEGQYAKACPKLAESHRLDPGGGTLLNLAVCHENEGKTATAWGEFKEALGMARADGRQDRVELANEHIAALEPRLSRLVITVDPAAQVAGLVVEVDGTEMGEPVWGIPTPVDPGQRTIGAEAPGHERWETTITVGTKADLQTVVVPALQRVTAPAAPASAPAPDAETATAPASPSGDAVAPTDGSTQRLVGYIVGGAGIASAIVGGIFGGLAIAKESEAEETCDDTICSTKDGMNASEAAKTHATLANVFVGAGVGLAAAGVIIVLTAPDGPSEEGASATSVAPWLGPGEAGLLARIRW